MEMQTLCACCGLSRRQLMASVAAATAATTGAATEARAHAAPQRDGVKPIDIHAHYFSRGFLELIHAEGARFNAKASFTEAHFSVVTPAGGQPNQPMKFIDLKERLADMDTQGVAMQALSLTSPMTYWADNELSHKLSRQWNDDAVAAHQAHPNRFVVFAALPMLDPDRAVDELNRASKLPGVRGVYMGTNINNRDLDDPLFAPIFARIEALDLPVFLHPLQTLGGARLGAYYLNNLLGNPFETAIAASRLIFGGVMDRHPKLQVNLPHAGGALPILIGRIDHGWKVRREARHLADAPSTYLRRFIYDTIAHSKPIMEFVIAQVGIDRVMIGSDYCYDMGPAEPLAIADEVTLGPADRKLLLAGNARKLLRL